MLSIYYVGYTLRRYIALRYVDTIIYCSVKFNIFRYNTRLRKQNKIAEVTFVHNKNKKVGVRVDISFMKYLETIVVKRTRP